MQKNKGELQKTIRKTWSREEDNLIIDLVKEHGSVWSAVQLHLPGRNAKQCRERWVNKLAPHKTGTWTREEEQLLVRLQSEFGNKFTTISGHIGGRSANDVKNHWHHNLKCGESISHLFDSSTNTGEHTQPEGRATMSYPNWDEEQKRYEKRCKAESEYDIRVCNALLLLSGGR